MIAVFLDGPAMGKRYEIPDGRREWLVPVYEPGDIDNTMLDTALYRGTRHELFVENADATHTDESLGRAFIALGTEMIIKARHR